MGGPKGKRPVRLIVELAWYPKYVVIRLLKMVFLLLDTHTIME